MKGIAIAASVGLIIGLSSPGAFAKTYYYFYTTPSGKQVTVVSHTPRNMGPERRYVQRNYSQERYINKRVRNRTPKTTTTESSDEGSSNYGGGNYSGGSRKFVFSPREHKWYAYHNGKVVNSGRASGGKGYCPDIRRSCRTPQGTFAVRYRGPANCRSTRYPVGKGGARMDYCVFFSNYYAVHGSNDVPNYNASHGCIRVVPSAARWLNQNFLRPGDRVVVTSY